MKTFDDCLAAPDWKVSHHDKKEQLLIEKCKNTTGKKSIKATGYVDSTVQDVFDMLIDETEAVRNLYDSNYDKFQYLDQIGPQTQYYYEKSKSEGGVSARDFVLCFHYNMVKD